MIYFIIRKKPDSVPEWSNGVDLSSTAKASRVRIAPLSKTLYPSWSKGVELISSAAVMLHGFKSH